MNRPTTVVLIAMLASTVAACSAVMDVTFSGGLASPQIIFSENGKPKSVCVDGLALFRQAAGSSSLRIWAIRAADGRCVRVRSLRYGVTPDGFVEEAPPEALVENVEYRLGFNAWTRDSLPSVPVYTAESVRVFSKGRWSEKPEA